MILATNIVKYRKINQLSQEQLAKALSISRQSISKWETGENLPSIDNLISLSGLLDISLDELITGEPYLHFPFNYGKPKNRGPLFILFPIFIFGIILYAIFRNFYVPIIGIVASYFMIIFLMPFDFKRYYTYWSLGKRGITYASDTKDTYNSWDEVVIPVKALFHIRKSQYISYKRIKRIEIKLDLFKANPNSTIVLSGMYSATSAQYMHENFYFILTTTDNKKIYWQIL